MGEESMGENFVKSMGEKMGEKSMGEERWLKKTSVKTL